MSDIAIGLDRILNLRGAARRGARIERCIDDGQSFELDKARRRIWRSVKDFRRPATALTDEVWHRGDQICVHSGGTTASRRRHDRAEEDQRDRTSRLGKQLRRLNGGRSAQIDWMKNRHRGWRDMHGVRLQTVSRTSPSLRPGLLESRTAARTWSDTGWRVNTTRCMRWWGAVPTWCSGLRLEISRGTLMDVKDD